jgi:hypothetical protein
LVGAQTEVAIGHEIDLFGFQGFCAIHGFVREEFSELFAEV